MNPIKFTLALYSCFFANNTYNKPYILPPLLFVCYHVPIYGATIILSTIISRYTKDRY